VSSSRRALPCYTFVKERADMDDRKDLYLSGALTINGQLHCKGDFEVKGNVSLKPGSNLIVDGKRTIHGSLREVK
jgi:cytoskeletal protein CcmA (bactofilin family)